MIDLNGYGPSILEGAGLTVMVALVSLVIAIVLGLVTAAMKLSKSRAAKGVAQVYTTIVRGVPDLVLMLLIFFGGQVLVNNSLAAIGYDEFVDINPFIAGSMTIGFIYGAYLGETFRGAILAVEVGLLEAGHAYGMTRWQVFIRILLPQMMRHALPGFGNNWLVLQKATALVSIIGLEDMVRKAGLAAGATREPFKFYFVVALLFLTLTTVSVLLLRWAEKHYSAGVRRA